MRGLFITGTDTNVGKTVVAAALMHRFRKEIPLRYWKPIQTGIEEDDDTATVRSLGNCNENEIFNEGVRLNRPISPHLAAKLSGKKISTEQIYSLAATNIGKESWIVEAAGGVLVPINDSEQMVDLARILSLPVVVVISTRLGTINHTLLTCEALRKRALIIAGVVMVGDKNPQIRETIEAYGLVQVLGEMPTFPDLNRETLSRWARRELDERGVLLHHLKLAHRAHPQFKL